MSTPQQKLQEKIESVMTDIANKKSRLDAAVLRGGEDGTRAEETLNAIRGYLGSSIGFVGLFGKEETGKTYWATKIVTGKDPDQLKDDLEKKLRELKAKTGEVKDDESLTKKIGLSECYEFPIKDIGSFSIEFGDEVIEIENFYLQFIIRPGQNVHAKNDRVGKEYNVTTGVFVSDNLEDFAVARAQYDDKKVGTTPLLQQTKIDIAGNKILDYAAVLASANFEAAPFVPTSVKDNYNGKEYNSTELWTNALLNLIKLNRYEKILGILDSNNVEAKAITNLYKF